MWEKLKGELVADRTYYSCIVVFVALAAFALGRYSVTDSMLVAWRGGGESANAIASLAYTKEVVATATVPVPESVAESVPVIDTPRTTGAFVASRNGTKYHDVRCGSAARIIQANRIYFDSESAARAAGYTPAANCPLLSP